MRLSKGRVVEGRLVCPYHGWRFEHCGQGTSPGTPRLCATARRFETTERHGIIWVKAEGPEATIPEMDYPGYYRIHTFQRRVKVPLLILLDNFTEIEHAATAHFTLGYPLEAMSEVRMSTEVDDRSVRVVTEGPQKWIPWAGSLLFGMYTRDRVSFDWTTRFSPVHTEYEVWWQTPSGERHRGFRMKYIVFFRPVTDTETQLFGCYFSTMKPWGVLGLNILRRLVLAGLIGYEFELDRRVVENLADFNTSLRGAQLGRFDRPLVEQRKRLARIYYGVDQPSADPEAGLTEALRVAEPSSTHGGRPWTSA
jgi:hypothetical protein